MKDWTLEKQFKSVPNVVDVVSFGGTTREYQVRIDPDKLVSYGLTLSQVEQALANNNVNAGGSFVEAGLQQINVRALGLFHNVGRYRPNRAQNSERNAAARLRHCHRGARLPHPARPDRQSHPSNPTARFSITTTWWKALCFCARAPRRRPRSRPSKRKGRS